MKQYTHCVIFERVGSLSFLFPSLFVVLFSLLTCMHVFTHTYIHTHTLFLSFSLSLSFFSNYTSLDQKREAVILPIFGMATPFHISTVKNTSYNDQDEEQVMLRINFSAPGAFARQAEFAKVFRSSLCNDIFPVCSLH